MPLLPETEIAQACQIDLVELCQNELAQKGKNKGNGEIAFVCPFHNDRNPSMMVNREKGVYHCLGCGAKGNSIHFVKEYRGVGFVEAVNYLNGKETIKEQYIPKEIPKVVLKKEIESKPIANNRLLMDFISHLLVYLSEEDYNRIESYLNNRALGLSDFGFGTMSHPTLYPLPKMNYEAFGHVRKVLLETYSEQELLEHGLYSEKGFSQYMGFDFVFVYYGEKEQNIDYPITNLQARKIQPKEGELREIFVKGKQVLPYNLHLLAELPFKSNVFLVEAPIDAVSLYKILKSPLFLPYRGSRPYVVSTGGSQIKSERIIQICQQQEHKVWLAMDNDTAGQKANQDWLQRLTEQGVVANIFRGIPVQYKDPNDYLKANKKLFST